ncbi:hypothetical protein [Arenibacter nanhaiticus]|uniref:hypothetical protein n=1 Tax=Arenibacter nanhaiticus TaxID=558155 RepID=UPI00116036A7|nr:hypothetical protein [Arenibacter nanhaiticus]
MFLLVTKSIGEFGSKKKKNTIGKLDKTMQHGTRAEVIRGLRRNTICLSVKEVHTITIKKLAVWRAF